MAWPGGVIAHLVFNLTSKFYRQNQPILFFLPFNDFLLIVMPAILDARERVGISHIILKTKYHIGTMFLAEDFNVIFSYNQ